MSVKEIEMGELSLAGELRADAVSKKLREVLHTLDEQELNLIEQYSEALVKEGEEEASQKLKTELDALRKRKKHLTKVFRDVKYWKVRGSSLAQVEKFSKVEEDKLEKFQRGLDKITIPFLLFEVLMIIFYSLFADYTSMTSQLPTATTTPIAGIYNYYTGVAIMVYIGFGYLMTFLRRYGFGAVGFTFLISSVVVQWAILTQAFFNRVYDGNWSTIQLNISWLIDGQFAAATVMISFGAVLGKTGPHQLFYLSFLECIFYSLNFYIGNNVLKAVDAGGSMFIHAFGAFYGLSASYFLSPRKASEDEDNSSRYTSDLFSLIGTVFLWLYWPSFNAALTGDYQYRTVINTTLSLTASCITAFSFSRMLRGSRKFDLVDIQNATLAGGVAVGASSDLLIYPGGAISIGAIAGALSVTGFVFFSPWVEEKLSIQDTCGILNLHGIPGIMGGLGAAVATASSTSSRYTVTEYDEKFLKGDSQSAIQLATLGITLGIAMISGFLSGYIIKKIAPDEPKKCYFKDEAWWEITPEYKIIHSTAGVAQHLGNLAEDILLDKASVKASSSRNSLQGDTEYSELEEDAIAV